MKVFYYIYIRSILWCFLGAFSLQATNELKKVYSHENSLTYDVVFSFKDYPQCAHIPASFDQAESTKEIHRFVFPAATIKGKDVRSVLNQLSVSSLPYRVTVSSVDYPVKGLEFIVEFEKEKVGLQVELFDAISNNNTSIAFKFIKKSSTQQINKASYPLLRTSFLKKKSI